jgi:hypothetical protein
MVPQTVSFDGETIYPGSMFFWEKLAQKKKESKVVAVIFLMWWF